MNTRKGMSQTLALIVAASVLMMTALTVIFLAQGALGDLGQDSADRGCNGALDAKAATVSVGDSTSIPANCVTSDGNLVPTAESRIGAVDGEVSTTDTIHYCSEGPNGWQFDACG